MPLLCHLNLPAKFGKQDLWDKKHHSEHFPLDWYKCGDSTLRLQSGAATLTA